MAVRELAHLLNEFDHVFRASTGGRLVRHRRDPFNPALVEQTLQCQQHQADRAVSTDEVTSSIGHRFINDSTVDGIQNDHGIVSHPKR